MKRVAIDQHSFWRRATSVAAAVALVCGVGVALTTSPADAASITHVQTVTNTDFVTAGATSHRTATSSAPRRDGG